MDQTPRTQRQPWLHELAVCVDGNATALSDASGNFAGVGAQGLFVDDRRVLSRLALTVAGEPPDRVDSDASGARAEFVLSARGLGNTGQDSTVEVRRSRVLSGSSLEERVTVTSRADAPITCQVELALASDGAEIADVKSGLSGHLATPQLIDGSIHFVDGRHRTRVHFGPGPAHVEVYGEQAVATVQLNVPPGGSTGFTVRVDTTRLAETTFDAESGSGAVHWDAVYINAADPRFAPAVQRSFEDLQHLLLRDPEQPADIFAAAGTPWYLTLFGRDSLWAARMMLPFGTQLAAGTLHALARRQGTRTDPGSAEAPGKILHEIRRTAYVASIQGLNLPPLYYGTVDATALWVTLLGEAQQWGLPREEVTALLPSLRAAVGWLLTDARPDSDGFLKYVDESGTGLVNQGWKDSADAIRWRDGRLAEAPIALLEAQSYAVEALGHAGRLYEWLGEDGADALRAAARDLTGAIRRAFWVETDAGRYLAMALDRNGTAVTGLGSNMAHALGTGVLTPEEARAVADTLMGPELLDDFGIHTLGTGNGGYNPIGYHTGSIWTHDTAIAAWGLAREGLWREAGEIARRLLASAETFDYRWPELYAGEATLTRPAPYPASCRPQAWSAASAAVLVTVALGLQPDTADDVLRVQPGETGLGQLSVAGLAFGGRSFSASVDASGEVTVVETAQRSGHS